MVQVLIALVLLQLAAANLGGHQLHAGNSAEQESEHAHLQYVAMVETLAQFIDCVCEADALCATSQSEHQHLVTELKQVDLCLDCQCHGGVVSMLSHMSALPDSQPDFISPFSDTPYLPPLMLPEYRPPIA
ncbi:MAG: hypothetical protein LPD71_08455 [Shewanella sp.]|nr:hypothetical protein [Shewanella sp.]MCF1430739.1 hypothetical protein [Shewanella sp.]MCF1438760.1 hypothetical protein [Shewanella sp.]MCF1459694.1 hypothetical protein [Shewanella sp.]